MTEPALARSEHPGAPSALPDPPGPRGLPVVGVLPQIWRDPLGFFRNVALQCGPVARVGLGRYTLFLVSEPDLIGRVLQDPERIFWKGEGLAAASQVVGKGLVTSEGEHWQRQHRLVRPAFSRQSLARYLPTIDETVREMVSAWKLRARSPLPFDITTDLNELTLKIICRTLFGTDLPASESSALCRAVLVAIEHINHSAWRLLPLPESIPTPRRARFRRALRLLDASIYQLIESRRKSAEERDDLLGHLLAARDESGRGMDDRQIRDEIATVFVAGHETPANGLAWAFYLLGKHPIVERQIADEAEAVLGNHVAEPDALDRLERTDMAIRESMRLYPPAWVVVRTPRRDTELAGYRVPAGSPLLLCQYVMHRHPDYWDEPDLYRPERWEPENVERQQRFQYFPFGGGTRVCIGSQLAMQLMKLTVARVLRELRLELDPCHKVIPRPLTTLLPKNGVRAAPQVRA